MSERRRVGTRGCLREGLEQLARRPLVTASAVIAGAASALAFAAANRAFAALASRHLARGAGVWILGGTVGALLGAAALAAAVSAPRSETASMPQPDEPSLDGARSRGASDGGALIGRSLRHGVALLSLIAVERVIEGSLLLATAAIALRTVARLRHPTPSMLAASVAAAAAAPLVVALIAVPAFRIAVAEAASGTESWLALSRGCAVALADFPSVASVGLAALAATSPLWLLALALGRAAATTASAPAAAAMVALGGALALGAAAWGYGSLATLSRRLATERGLPASD
jgi:hypothetical protein